ncbi:MAG: DUF3108 domain-containing protein, partial [Alphaproteobacteria bacterium]
DAPAVAPAPEAARFGYNGYVGGIKIGEATMEIAFARARYAAKVQLETGGLLGWFVEWRNGSEAYGAPTPAGDAPLSIASYRNDSFWKGEDRFVEVAYPDGVGRIVRADPHPVTDEGRPAVPPDLLTNVLDPISAIAAIGRRIEATGRCDASFGVFDGRRRYQFKVRDEGETDIGKSGSAPFGGVARKCAFVFENVAGFKVRKNKKPSEPTRGVAYFRRAEAGAPTMPVKVETESDYGSVILLLREVQTIDPELAQQAARKIDGPAPE